MTEMPQDGWTYDGDADELYPIPARKQDVKPTTEMPPMPCQQEVFANKFGTVKAVVCSCGFATTYTVLHNDADQLGLSHFDRMHGAHLERIAKLTAEVERLKKVAELHNDSAVEAWKLTQEAQQERFRLEAENIDLQGKVAVANRENTHLKAALNKIADGSAFQQDADGTCISDAVSVSRAAIKEAVVSQDSIVNAILLRLNDRLIEMKPEFDDSITGFNEALEIVRDVLSNPIKPAAIKEGQ